MKKYGYLLVFSLILLQASCSSDDDGAGDPIDTGESSMTLSGDYNLNLEGNALFSIGEESFQDLHQFTISLSGNEEKQYNMDLILRLEDMNYQVLEGSSLPISNVILANEAEAFSTDFVLYGDSFTDIVAEWTSIEDEGEGLGTVTITRADNEIVEGTLQATLTPKSGNATSPITISNGSFRAVLSE